MGRRATVPGRIHRSRWAGFTTAPSGAPTANWSAGCRHKRHKSYPDYGQAIPPAGKFVDVAAGGLFTCGVREDHTLGCWGYNFYGQVKRAPAGEFKQVNAGMGGHAFAMSDSNELYCWGRNDFGQTHIELGGSD